MSNDMPFYNDYPPKSVQEDWHMDLIYKFVRRHFSHMIREAKAYPRDPNALWVFLHPHDATIPLDKTSRIEFMREWVNANADKLEWRSAKDVADQSKLWTRKSAQPLLCEAIAAAWGRAYSDYLDKNEGAQ
jgi:hypothetical protein